MYLKINLYCLCYLEIFFWIDLLRYSWHIQTAHIKSLEFESLLQDEHMHHHHQVNLAADGDLWVFVVILLHLHGGAHHRGRHQGPRDRLRGLWDGVRGLTSLNGVWDWGRAGFHGITLETESYSDIWWRSSALLHWSFNLHFSNNIEYLFLCLFAIHVSS